MARRFWCFGAAAAPLVSGAGSNSKMDSVFELECCRSVLGLIAARFVEFRCLSSSISTSSCSAAKLATVASSSASVARRGIASTRARNRRHKPPQSPGDALVKADLDRLLNVPAVQGNPLAHEPEAPVVGPHLLGGSSELIEPGQAAAPARSQMPPRYPLPCPCARSVCRSDCRDEGSGRTLPTPPGAGAASHPPFRGPCSDSCAFDGKTTKPFSSDSSLSG